MTTAAELASAAQEALQRGDMPTAFEQASSSLEAGDEALAHDVLAILLYANDAFEQAHQHFQQAFAGWQLVGERGRAARCAIRLASLETSMHGHESAGQGWVERARTLLEQVGPCVEWGYLELALLSCDRTDLPCLLAASERALAIARTYADRGLEALARADRGLALVSQGRAEEGFLDLEAAMTGILTGELPLPHSGIALCAMLTACDRVGDVRRAERWTSITRELASSLGDKPVALYVHCRVAWGSVLRVAGRWQEAEEQLLEALGSTQRPFLSHRALTSAHLAGLRIDQGRYEDAAVLLAPFEDRVTSSAPLALLHLHRGQPDVAAAVLNRALDELVDDTLRAVPVLTALVQVELARGRPADEAVARLEALALRADVAAVRAAVALAHARVAVAVGQDAQPSYAAALRDLEDRPFQSGLVRLELAAALDDPSAAIAEARAALACFTRLGATEARDRAVALLRSLGERVRPQQVVDGLLTEREGEVLALLEQGLTNAAIGDRLFISAKTAEHHVSRILAKLGVRSRAEAAALTRGK